MKWRVMLDRNGEPMVDNVTTNGVAMTTEVATRLVKNKAREVIFSLNAVDAPDYARMMKVKPALFDKVLENIRNLVAIRGDSLYPSIVVQFLIDRTNMHRLVEMYELGRSLSPDRIAINQVLEIPNERIDEKLIVGEDDVPVAEPLEEPEPLQRLDPLTKGSLFHEVQAEFYRSLQNTKQPIGSTPIEAVLQVLDDTLGVLLKYRDDLERIAGDEAARLVGEAKAAAAA